MIFQDWYTIIVQAFQNLWQGFANLIPSLIGAIVIFVIGWFISVGIGKLVTKVLNLFRVNQLFCKGNVDEALEKAGIKADVTGFLGSIVKWILVLVFLISATEILGFIQFAEFLSNVLAYLPNVVVAVLIFIATVIVIEIIEKILIASFHKLSPSSSHMVALVVRWSIWVFAVFAILLQLGIAPQLVEVLIQGIVGVLVIGFGLAFGLGGKEVAGEFLQDLKRKIKG